MKRSNGKKRRKKEPPLPDAGLERYAEILKALANPARLKLVNILAEGERTVSELVRMSGLKQSLVSQQLKTLRLNDIVSCRKEVTNVFYSLKEKNVIGMLDCLCRCGDRQRGSVRRKKWLET